MKINLVFTNDWEVFGEGSGDFTDLQERPLREMFEVFAQHQARFTLFAEIGQQWAHRHLGQYENWARAVADRWENLIDESLRLGHDVQLHLHPTWLNAKFKDNHWQLDFDHWQLKTLDLETIEEVLSRGRKTLEDIGRKTNADYRCLAFRAGAFCIQPEDQTVPALLRSGILCDSSVVPGMTDHLFFDFRRARSEPGSYMASQINLGERAEKNEPELLELPVHTAKVWDIPLLRKCLPASVAARVQFGAKPDPVFNDWVKSRDERMKRIYPADRQPLKEKRAHALRGIHRWAGFLLRRSVITLDYDYSAPDIFVRMVERAGRAAQKNREKELTLVALGHAKNVHSAENINRILQKLKFALGSHLHFKTVQQSVEEQLGKVVAE